MFYIIYKTTNLVNNKFYIGKHQQHIDPHQFDGYYGSKFFYNPTTNERKRFKSTDIISEGWINSLEYAESQKKTNWFNDGTKNYLLKIGDSKIEKLGLIRGRLAVPKS